GRAATRMFVTSVVAGASLSSPGSLAGGAAESVHPDSASAVAANRPSAASRFFMNGPLVRDRRGHPSSLSAVRALSRARVGRVHIDVLSADSAHAVRVLDNCQENHDGRQQIM